jgi:hypothetical protein
MPRVRSRRKRVDATTGRPTTHFHGRAIKKEESTGEGLSGPRMRRGPFPHSAICRWLLAVAVFWAILGNARRLWWQIWQLRQRGICNLQIATPARGFESHPHRQNIFITINSLKILDLPVYDNVSSGRQLMLTLYRRHTGKCGRQDRYYRRCKCSVWVEGTTDAGLVHSPLF